MQSLLLSCFFSIIYFSLMPQHIYSFDNHFGSFYYSVVSEETFLFQTLIFCFHFFFIFPFTLSSFLSPTHWLLLANLRIWLWAKNKNWQWGFLHFYLHKHNFVWLNAFVYMYLYLYYCIASQTPESQAPQINLRLLLWHLE